MPAAPDPVAGDHLAIARLELEAAPACATRADLAARVGVRSPRIRLAEEAAPGPLLHAVLAPAAGGGVSVELTIDAGSGRRSSRRLTAATCEEAIDALAVVIAVLLDPDAMQAAPVPPAPPAIRSQAGDRSEPVTTEPATWRVGAGAGAHGVSGPAPGIMPGVALDLRVLRDRAASPSPTFRVSPMARVVLGHAGLSGWSAPGGRAAFTFDSAELDLCPFALATGPAALRGCAAAVVGRLGARGSDTFDAEAHTRFFAALGGAALLTVRLGASPVALEGAVAAGRSLARDAFAFSPTVFYRVAPLTLAGVLGLSLTFP